MRIDLGSLDPSSKLAERIRQAMARDAEARHGACNGAARGLQSSSIGQPRKASVHAMAGASEEALQRSIVAMIAAEGAPGLLAFHVPNGGRRGKAEAGRFRVLGVLAGIPDLIVICNGRVLGLEIKTAAGRLSASQKIMRERFIRCGAEYEVARSVDEARHILQKWAL